MTRKDDLGWFGVAMLFIFALGLWFAGVILYVLDGKVS